MSHHPCSRSCQITTVLLMIAAVYIFNVYMLKYQFFLFNQTRPKALEVRANLTSVSPYNQSVMDSDFKQLVGLNDFQFLINDRRCDGDKVVFLVVFVHSNPYHFDYRKAIRDTWGNERNLPNNETMRVVFLLGAVLNATLQQELANENELYHDIVQGNFIDAYHNLTYKFVMGLGWVTRFCKQARFILKTDDDLLVNVPQLARTLNYTMGDKNSTCHFICLPIRDSFVLRNGKWKVTYQELASDRYPDYCSGWIILMSPDIAASLYALSHEVPFFWVDDVYVTGILAQRLGIEHWSFDKWISAVGQDGYPIGAFSLNVQQIYEKWNKQLKV